MDAEGDIIRQMLDLTEKETKMSEKQRRIVAASIELFAEKGYAGTSTNEIAKKLGSQKAPFLDTIKRKRFTNGDYHANAYRWCDTIFSTKLCQRSV